jgi:hypothetical protein
MELVNPFEQPDGRHIGVASDAKYPAIWQPLPPGTANDGQPPLECVGGGRGRALAARVVVLSPVSVTGLEAAAAVWPEAGPHGRLVSP